MYGYGQVVREGLKNQKWGGWTIGEQMNLNPHVVITEEIDNLTAKGVMGSDLCVNVLRLDKQYYDLYQYLRYKNIHTHHLKVYGVSSVEDGHFLAATEEYEDKLNEWMHKKKNDPNVKCEEILEILRSLIQSVIVLSDRYGDFTFKDSHVMVISRMGDTPYCKIGMVKECPPKNGLTFKCILDIVDILDKWHFELSSRTAEEIVRFKKFMETLRHTDDRRSMNNSLKWLLEYPIFYGRKKKLAAFEFVIKFYSHCEMNDEKTMPDVHEIIKSFECMGYTNILETTRWFNDAKANVDYVALMNATILPKKPTQLRECRSISHEMAGFFKGFRNISVHVVDKVKCLDELENCYNGLEVMMPGCWSALYHLCHSKKKHVAFVEKDKVI